MKKPQKQIKPSYIWDEAIKYLENKYNFNHHDYLGTFGANRITRLKEIKKELEINDADLEGYLDIHNRTDSEVIRKLAVRNKLYKENVLRDPIHLDFWEQLCDIKNVSHSRYIPFSLDDLDQDYSYVDEVFNTYGGKDESHDGKWVNTIIGYILEEFGEGENKVCEFFVNW